VSPAPKKAALPQNLLSFHPLASMFPLLHWACTDGRTALGVIDLVDGAYVTSVDGVITGTFRTRLEAARSFTVSGSTDSGGRATGCLPRKTDYQPTNLEGGFPW
jgi:hypothetical protein